MTGGSDILKAVLKKKKKKLSGTLNVFSHPTLKQEETLTRTYYK